MRPYYSYNDADSDGFSTIFGDLVFGLLFVFFLLAIALVFNRPDVDAFQDRVDEMQARMRQALEEKGKLNLEIAALQKEIAAAQEKGKGTDQRLQQLAQERKRLEEDGKKKIQALSETNRMLHEALKKVKEACNDLNDRRKSLNASRDNAKFSLQKQIDAQKKQATKLQKDLTALKAEQAWATGEQKRTEMDAAEVDALLLAIKEYLAANGLADILAELEGMEETLAQREEAREGKSDEELFSDTVLDLAYDPRYTDLTGDLWQGKKKVLANLTLNKSDLTQLAKEIMADYSRVSKNYTELEKKEHRPKVLLRVHPDAPYGEVQAMVAAIRRHIPVSIVAWKK